MTRKHHSSRDSETKEEKRTSFAEQDPAAEEVRVPEEEEEKAREKGQGTVEYMRVEDVFIVPAVGTFQEDFDLDGQEYCLSCFTTPRPTMCDSTMLGRKRKQIICPNCLARVKTYIDHGFKKRALGHSWVVPFVGFCCALYAIPCFHTVRHYCPQCKVFLGQRRGLLSVKEREVKDRDTELITQQDYYQKKEGGLLESMDQNEDTKERKRVKKVREKLMKKQKKEEKRLKRDKKKKSGDIALEEQQEKAEPEPNIPDKSKDVHPVSSGEELQKRHNRPSKSEALEEPFQSPPSDQKEQQQTGSFLPGTEDASETSFEAEKQGQSEDQQRSIGKQSKHSQESKKHEQPKKISKRKKWFQHPKRQGAPEPPVEPVEELSEQSQVAVSSDQPEQPEREPSKESPFSKPTEPSKEPAGETSKQPQDPKIIEKPEPVKESSKQSEVSKPSEPPKEPVEEPSKEPVKEPLKQSQVSKPSKEPVEEPSKEPVKDPLKQFEVSEPSEPSKEPVEEPLKQSEVSKPSEPSKEPVGEASKQSQDPKIIRKPEQ